MKAFSLMEVIISIVILSFVMITLLQIKSENIFLISKSNENTKANDYILLAIDFKNQIEDKNEEIDLYKNYKFENEDIRKELKDIKVVIKDEKIDSESINSDSNTINITTYSRTFTLENTDIQKKLYSFKLEL